MRLFQDKRIYPVLLGLLALIIVWTLSAPKDFPTRSIINIQEGSSLQEISQTLVKEHLVRSTFWFRTFAILLGGERGMKAGQYYFETSQSAPLISWRIFRGDHRIETIKVTVPEGFTVAKIAALFDKRFAYFNKNLFLTTAPEGYLFPDTYFMPVTATASSTIKVMKDNFIRKIFPVMPAIEASKKTLEDVIRMASLLEAEGKTQADRELISDILWKRLKLGMALQVDSEMGTYSFSGLPEKPINNPGLVSIKAALHASSTPYLYFLTGTDGNMHYAKTFEEHKANIAKYLSN